jgi:thioesterase domain-containing protein
VLDEHLHPVPAGGLGDLYLAGPGLARGYPECSGPTAAAFVACPSGPPGARMHWTGQRASLTPDGGLILAGPAREPVTGPSRASVAGPGDFSTLLPLRPGGDRPPLFCVHPGVGLSWGYASLAKYLPADRPLYGLQARGLADDEPLPASITEMATDYVAAIRTVQPAGPYHLLGWSTGGVIAQAIAAELHRDGAEVGLLAVLDGYPREATRSFTATRPGGGGSPGTPARTLIRGPADREIEEVSRLMLGGTAGISDDMLPRLKAVLANTGRIREEHTPAQFDGDLLLFIAMRDRPALLPADRAAASWAPYVAGHVQEHRIDSNHFGMMRPGPLSEIGHVIAGQLRQPTVNPRKA